MLQYKTLTTLVVDKSVSDHEIKTRGIRLRNLYLVSIRNCHIINLYVRHADAVRDLSKCYRLMDIGLSCLLKRDLLETFKVMPRLTILVNAVGILVLWLFLNSAVTYYFSAGHCTSFVFN